MAETAISGAEKAAILLMSLGEQGAAALLKQLDARAVQKLGTTMATMKEVPRDRVNEVMNNFLRTLESKGGATSPSTEFVRRVLTNSVGKQRADMLLDRILSGAGAQGQGIEALRWMDPKAVAQLIGKEHPQVVAIVLAHLDGEQSSGVLALLPEALRADVLIRIATLGEIPQSALTELDQLVERQATSVASSPTRQMGGAKIVADIINSLDKDKSAEVLAKIHADRRAAASDESRICCSCSTTCSRLMIAAFRRCCAKCSPISWRSPCVARSPKCRTRFFAICRSARPKS